MPASLNANPFSSDQQCEKGSCRNPSARCLEKSSKRLHIGLVNNMPDGALEATERQFLTLLNAASEGMSVRLSLYSLSNVPRNEFGARHVSQHYASVESLWGTQLDGLIVTGREPQTPKLDDEPYWQSFTGVLDWAQANTYSAIWSCLAAHAATLYMDGISRVRHSNKHSGVFECSRLLDHPLTAGTPRRFKLPHSRWNGLSDDELLRRGYRVLTQAAHVGVDTFIKHCRSMFLFFQGHPEYEANTLLLEYRRDVGRFLRGEAENYPLAPQGYFNDETAEALLHLEKEATISRDPKLLVQLTAILEATSLENSWHSTAISIYRNWLQYICAQKNLRLQSSRRASVQRSSVDAHAIVPVAAAGSGTATANIFTVL